MPGMLDDPVVPRRAGSGRMLYVPPESVEPIARRSDAPRGQEFEPSRLTEKKGGRGGSWLKKTWGAMSKTGGAIFDDPGERFNRTMGRMPYWLRTTWQAYTSFAGGYLLGPMIGPWYSQLAVGGGLVALDYAIGGGDLGYLSIVGAGIIAQPLRAVRPSAIGEVWRQVGHHVSEGINYGLDQARFLRFGPGW